MAMSFDWTHLQAFVAVADHGSLSGAARALGGSQPTMGRHVGALEAELGVQMGQVANDQYTEDTADRGARALHKTEPDNGHYVWRSQYSKARAQRSRVNLLVCFT